MTFPRSLAATFKEQRPNSSVKAFDSKNLQSFFQPNTAADTELGFENVSEWIFRDLKFIARKNIKTKSEIWLRGLASFQNV